MNLDPELLRVFGAGLLNTYQPGGFLAGAQNEQGLLDQGKNSALNRSIAQKRLAMDEATAKRNEEESALKAEAMSRANEFERKRLEAANRANVLLNPTFPYAQRPLQDRLQESLLARAPYDDKALGLLMEQVAPTEEQYGKEGTLLQNPETGDYMYGQFSGRGGFKPVELPKGFVPALPTTYINAGSQVVPRVTKGAAGSLLPITKDLPLEELPSTKGAQAEATATGRTRGEETAKSALEFPSYEANALETIRMVEELRDHPGMSISVGKSSVMMPWVVPGTDASDFKARLDQVQGRQFLEAFQNLKGGGQITEVEGKKATEAISRMKTSQSEREFIAAANEFIGIVRSGIERARKKAGGGSAQSTPTTQPSSSGWSIKKVP